MAFVRRQISLSAIVATALAVAFLMLINALPAAAATSFTISGLTAAVTGQSVTVAVTFKSSATTTVDLASICVRSDEGDNVDFRESANLSIATSGTKWQDTATFAPGTYRFFACLKDDGAWSTVGATQTFTVSAAATGGSGSGTSGSSGVAMPTGNIAGWRQTFAEDFTTNLTRGTFPGAYAGKWLSYTGFPNTSKAGDYDQSIISAQNGNLDLYLHAVGGRPKVAAPVPLVNGQWGGQTYGRFSVRMKADAAQGYGVAFLLWSDANNWNDGEIDFPESALDDVARGYNHCPGEPSHNCLVVNTQAEYTDWHTYTIEWTRTKLSYLVDGIIVGSTTTDIPTKPLHWVMQVETPDAQDAANSSGHLLIDWATVYSPA